MYEFNYQHPSSIAEAKSAHQSADDPRYMAGGMTLIPVLKQRLDKPSDVIDLQGISDLKGIKDGGDTITVGAFTTHHEVHSSDIVKSKIPALAYLAGLIGDPMVRNRGTMGGSLANSDPAADYPAAVLGLGATIVTDSREIAADNFFQGMFETALEPGEMITAIKFPVPKKAGYQKFPNPASRYAVVGAFVADAAEGIRVAITGAGPCAFRVKEMEDALKSNFSAGALDGITVPADDLNSDIHASAEYRAHLIGVMAKRAVPA
jgi:carbon-monoxide dehydrogenase medium subunit